MHEEPDQYASYLLRVWRAVEIRDTWRVSLESTRTHELRGFASLEEVFEFLRQRVEGGGESADGGKMEDSMKEEA